MSTLPVLEQNQTCGDQESRAQLLETARAMVLRGDKDFSVASVCGEAGVEPEIFREHFSGRTALMAAVMQSQSGAKPAAVAETESDAWLERRLRVFERALNALEAKAEATARDQARAIAQLEERLKAAPDAISYPAPQPEAVIELEPAAPVMPPAVVAPEAETVADTAPEPIPEPHDAEPAQDQALPADEATVEQPAVSKDGMAGVLQTAREKARAAHEPQAAASPEGARMRLLVIGGLALVAVFVCLGLVLGRNALGTSVRLGDGVTHRQQAVHPLDKTKALADAGNPRAQARLALAYLRGQGTAADANAALLWVSSAAKAGNPVAQYLLGALYQQGDHVKADPAIAFAWFARAAEKGNLKAMHNLAIAYAQGLGTVKDEAKAAEWFTRAAEHGYVDSAFDLAVLYERGEGVTQDLKQALKWYSIAALAGDQPSKERVEVLRAQMKPADIKLAGDAAASFSPLTALADANSL